MKASTAEQDRRVAVGSGMCIAPDPRRCSSTRAVAKSEIERDQQISGMTPMSRGGGRMIRWSFPGYLCLWQLVQAGVLDHHRRHLRSPSRHYRLLAPSGEGEFVRGMMHMLPLWFTLAHRRGSG